MKLNETDMKVLELVADDYYGLWEVSDYFVQLMPESSPEIARAISRERVSGYLAEGLVDMFVGTVTKGDFEKVDMKAAIELLSQEDSWATPQRIAPIVAVYLTETSKRKLGFET